MDNGASSSKLPTPEQVLAAIGKTGFMFEHEVARKLHEYDFTVDLNAAYTDPESGKQREIDVIAWGVDRIRIPQAGNRISEVLITTEVIAECKNFSDPLVIVGCSGHYGLGFHVTNTPRITFDPLRFEFADRDPKEFVGIYATLDMHNLPSFQSEDFIGNQLVKMRRQGGEWIANNDSVYDSVIIPLAKVVGYLNEAPGGEDGEDGFQPWDFPSFHYVFPALITAGDIFVVDMLPNGEPSARAVRWARIMRKFSDKNFVFDVVSFKHVGDYLRKRVLSVRSEAKEVIAKNLKMFNPEWLIREYGHTSDPMFSAWLKDFHSSWDDV